MRGLSLKNLLSPSTALLIAGCSINPTPVGFSDGQYIRDYTLEIIKRIRCEARDALVIRAAELIEALGDNYENKAVADALKEDPSNIKKFKQWDLDPRAYVVASPILNSTIGFDFTFTITETNDNSLSPKLTSSIGTNIFTLGISDINLKGERENKRLVNVDDQPIVRFQNLDCSGDEKNRNSVNKKKDYSYPLRGNIQLEKTIGTFIEFLNLDAKFETRAEMAFDAIRSSVSEIDGSVPAVPKTKENPKRILFARQAAISRLDKIVDDIVSCESIQDQSQFCTNAKVCYGNLVDKAGDVFTSAFYNKFDKPLDPQISISDTLKFTTTFSGGIEPKITYGAPSSLDIETVAFSVQPKRVDVHQVKVGITAAIPKKPETKSKAITLGSNPNGYKLQVTKKVPSKSEGPIHESCRQYANAPNKRLKFTKNSSVISTEGAFIEKRLSEEDRKQIAQDAAKRRATDDRRFVVDTFRELVDE